MYAPMQVIVAQKHKRALKEGIKQAKKASKMTVEVRTIVYIIMDCYLITSGCAIQTVVYSDQMYSCTVLLVLFPTIVFLAGKVESAHIYQALSQQKEETFICRRYGPQRPHGAR